MKKITSAAGLALRLTWVQTALSIAALCVGQWAAFLLVNNVPDQSLEFRLDDLTAWIGRLGNMALMLMLHYSLRGGKGSRIDYTLRRLSLSEMQVSAVWTLVFAGYFLIYWMVQTGMLFGMYAHYISQYGGSRNLLFVAAMRSDYFHYVLPLYEPWGFVRNAVLCLGFGSFAALGAQNARNGRWYPLCLAFLMMTVWALLSPQDVGWQWQDMTVTAVTVICVVWDWIWTWRWMRNEET